MFLLCFGAVWFYKARMIFSDASLVSFRRINLQDLESSQRRWGAFLTELVPLTLSKLHLPLRIILVAYSLSFNVFYLCVAGFLIFRCRLYALGVLMTCYYLLFVSVGYYWTNNEIHQGVAYMFLCLGTAQLLRERRISSTVQTLVFCLLSGIAIFTHPLAIIVFGFLWIALWMSKKDWQFNRQQAVLYSMVLLAWSVLKLALSTSQAYDSRRMHGVSHISKDILLHAFDGSVANRFYYACVTNYWPSILLMAVAAVVMLKERRWTVLLWLFSSGLSYFVLVHCGFPEGHFLYYLEGEWGIFGLISGFAIVYFLLPRLKPNTAALLIATLFAVRIAYIALASWTFTARIDFIEALNGYARRHQLNKVLIKASNSRFEERLFLDWGLATESMTLSALAKDKQQITLCSLWPDHPERIPHGNKEMVWNFDKRPASALNPYYFALDTTHPYVVVPYDEIERELR
jgi:hypothetical protein